MGIFNTKLFRFFGFKQKPNAPWNKYYNKEDMDFDVTDHKLEVYGYCKKCKTKPKD